MSDTMFDAMFCAAIAGGGGGGGFTPTEAQLTAMNSGITSTDVAQIETNKNNISLIKHAANTSIYIQETTPTGEIGDYWLSSENGVKVYGRTDNLFNTFDIIGQVPSINNGALVNYNGATCTPIELANGDVSISTNTSVTYLMLYDVNMAYIGYLQIDSDTIGYGKTIAGYENAKYCRVRIDNTTGLDNVHIMLNTGDSIKPYIPYYFWA